jgi:hypothetical protein
LNGADETQPPDQALAPLHGQTDPHGAMVFERLKVD